MAMLSSTVSRLSAQTSGTSIASGVTFAASQLGSAPAITCFKSSNVISFLSLFNRFWGSIPV